MEILWSYWSEKGKKKNVNTIFEGMKEDADVQLASTS